MTVMPANNTCWLVHYWAGRYGGLGHLYSPSRSERPNPILPYALDNGAFPAWRNGGLWDREQYLTHVERYAFASLRPQWAIVPDVVADREATLARWAHWAPILKDEYKLTLALAVQDGMDADDARNLSPKPEVIFVGGTTEWKWLTAERWCGEFARVHIGRVNGAKHLDLAQKWGAESCDGTGWFRGRSAQILELGRFLACQAGRYDACEELELKRVVFFSRTAHDIQPSLPFEAWASEVA